jgi:hypothetical protein
VLLLHKLQPVRPVEAIARDLLATLRQQPPSPGAAQPSQPASATAAAGESPTAATTADADYVMVRCPEGTWRACHAMPCHAYPLPCPSSKHAPAQHAPAATAGPAHVATHRRVPQVGAEAGSSPKGAAAAQGGDAIGAGPSLGRAQFAHLLGQYCKAAGARSFSEVADHLLAVAAAAPVDQAAACRPGWWFHAAAQGLLPEGAGGAGGLVVQELTGAHAGLKRKSGSAEGEGEGEDRAAGTPMEAE